jgi:acyl dehydratase
MAVMRDKPRRRGLQKRRMSKRHWEDFKPGTVTVYGPRLVTREEIVAFASEFDPQPMHLDETAAAATLLGGLAASGWHSCCLLMRIIADGFINDSHSMGAPGVDEVRWLKPLRPGTQVRVRATVLDTRASNSRPEIGFVNCLFEMIDDQDTVITTLISPLMVSRRDAGVRP